MNNEEDEIILPPLEEPKPKRDCILVDAVSLDVEQSACTGPGFGACIWWRVKYKRNGLWDDNYTEEFVRESVVSALSETYINPPGNLLQKVGIVSCKPS